MTPPKSSTASNKQICRSTSLQEIIGDPVFIKDKGETHRATIAAVAHIAGCAPGRSKSDPACPQWNARRVRAKAAAQLVQPCSGADQTMSRFGQDVLAKIKRTDTLSVQLEKNGRFTDAVHTYEQSSKMLNRCIQKRSEAQDVTVEEIKWLRVDYDIRCVQLVALCMLGARKSEGQTDSTPFLLLKKAEELTDRDGLHYCKEYVQRAAVYQNIANHYKKQKKYQAALQAAEKAVRINEKLLVRDRLPISYFLKACLHGLLNDPSNSGLMYTECLNLAEAQRPLQSRPSAPTAEDLQASETFNVLKAAVLHNMAIEWANLHMPDQSRDALASAMEVGVNCLPQNHPVILRILDTYKVMRQNFLFKGNEVAPIINRPSPPRSFMNTDGVVIQKPLPPKSPKNIGESITGNRSPRVQQVQRTSADSLQQPLQDISPQRPASRPAAPETAAIGLRESPRKRAAKRPMTTSGMPTSLIGRSLSPGATRTSHILPMPEEGYAHALGSKYNPYKEHVLAEARIFVARKKAASRIQKRWRFALANHRAYQKQLQASIRIQSVVRMHREKTKYNHALEAAKRIQAIWRGSLARRQYAKRFYSLVQIQRSWRGKNSRKKLALKKAKAVLIQAVMRGLLTRACMANQQASAVAIQSHMRRRINENAMKKTVVAAGTINRVFRGAHARRVCSKKAAELLEQELLTTREVAAVMEDLLSMAEALCETIDDAPASDLPLDNIVSIKPGSSNSDDENCDDKTPSADEQTPDMEVSRSACEDPWFDAADESVPPIFLDEAENEIAHESNTHAECGEAFDVNAEPNDDFQVLSRNEQFVQLDQPDSDQRLARSDTNQAILEVILSRDVSAKVDDVISDTIQKFVAIHLKSNAQGSHIDHESNMSDVVSVSSAVDEPAAAAVTDEERVEVVSPVAEEAAATEAATEAEATADEPVTALEAAVESEREAGAPLADSLEPAVNADVATAVADVVSDVVASELAATLMNQTSSRSHSMFTITVEACSNAVGVDGKQHICVDKLNLVDLAGSERQSKTGATGDRMKEATKINLSLSALGNVISALVDGKSQHIPYRDSKLTRLLQDSLGGNAKTVMIANCGPADYNYNETLSTLRYANRAKNIKNKPKINEDPKDAKIREYQEKIRELREALVAQEKSMAMGGSAGSGGFGNGGSGEKGGTGPQIIERIVEKTVVKREGVSEELLKKLKEDARREKMELKQKAQAEMKALLAEQSRTEEEREKLEKELAFKAQQKAEMAHQKDEMLSHLQEMEKKLISGGKVIDKAAKQERELREAQAKIKEQKRQEMLLARELAEKEDSNMLLEEQFATLQDEVDDKTRKLKKLWAKHKAASTEVEDLKAEFQAEKEDMLDTIRELTRQLKMKHLLLSHFVPFDEAVAIERRAKYDPEVDEWKVDRLETKPSSLRPKRPVSRRGTRRIESEYGRRNKLIDSMNMRWRADNVVILDMEMPERRTKDFEYGGGGGVGMNYWLERVGANEVEVSPSSNLLAASKEKASSSSSSSTVERSSTSSTSTASSSSLGASASSSASSKKPSSETAAASTGDNADKTREKSSSKKASSKRPPTAR